MTPGRLSDAPAWPAERANALYIVGRDIGSGGHAPCPECGQDDALVLIGACRHDHPLLLRWLNAFVHVYVTRVYVCALCDEVVTVTT